jgi:hypothetical protein
MEIKQIIQFWDSSLLDKNLCDQIKEQFEKDLEFMNCKEIEDYYDISDTKRKTWFRLTNVEKKPLWGVMKIPKDKKLNRPYCKYGEEILEKINSMRLLEKSCLEISDELNISPHVIAKICRKFNFYPKRLEGLDKRGWNKGLTYSRKSINQVLYAHNLKKKLLREGYKEPICEQCGWDYTKHPWWENVENKENCPLEIHHKDGNKENNSLENIQFLCPNCHSLTKTYRRRKRD